MSFCFQSKRHLSFKWFLCKARYANWSTTHPNLYTNDTTHGRRLIYKPQPYKQKPQNNKKPKENNNNKANLGPLKAHFLVKAGNGRFGCYILNLHVSHVIYTLDRFYVTLLYMKNKAHVGP